MPTLDDPSARENRDNKPNAQGTNVMGDWWEGVREQGELITWVVAGASTAPIILGLAGINPPWPKSVSVMTAFGQLLAMVWAYQTMRGKKNDKKIQGEMQFYLICLTICLAMYFALHSMFVFIIPTNHELATKGFLCSYDALRLDDISHYCPFVPLEKLKNYGYESDMIWVGWSVAVVQFIILALWIAIFYSLAFFLAAFVVNQQNKSASG